MIILECFIFHISATREVFNWKRSAAVSSFFIVHSHRTKHNRIRAMMKKLIYNNLKIHGWMVKIMGVLFSMPLFCLLLINGCWKYVRVFVWNWSIRCEWTEPTRELSYSFSSECLWCMFFSPNSIAWMFLRAPLILPEPHQKHNNPWEFLHLFNTENPINTRDTRTSQSPMNCSFGRLAGWLAVVSFVSTLVSTINFSNDKKKFSLY